MTINAFNLIDGIDGLAIGLGIIGGLFYFSSFYQFDDLNLLIFSIALCTGLLGLLYFNLSKRNKIFLGDTGSLLIGGLLVFFALNFISTSGRPGASSSFFMVMGSLLIPMFDMIRLTIVRSSKKVSPFRADREHIHHIVLDLLKGNHVLTSILILISQLTVIYIFTMLSVLKSTYLIAILSMAFVAYYALVELLRKRRGPGG